jgi:general secretion pathway protein G
MLRHLKNSRGMTLMEIMIVVAIIGFLAATLYPTITNRMNSAKIKQTKISIQQIVQALNNYNIDCNKYPVSLDLLTKPDAECSNWGPDPYMKKIPKDEWSRDFTYEVSGTSFVIKSPGYKGKEITSEDL